MYISYGDFCELLSKHIDNGNDFYLSLLENVIDNPNRYCGIFRLSNAKSKLIQNVTQSNEIKFGDILEELVTNYLNELGYENLPKRITPELNVDQFFTDGTDLYLVEMKVRDDHDSAKKRGQYSNFESKISEIQKQYPTKKIHAGMWFVDGDIVKNKKYYTEMMESKPADPLVERKLFYGGEFFATLNDGETAWEELIEILKTYRAENANNTIEIPDFGSSQEMLDALAKLDYARWKKLNSDQPKYISLRDDFFSSGDNLEKAKKMRQKDLNYKELI